MISWLGGKVEAIDTGQVAKTMTLVVKAGGP